jgi:hypothetical protein
MIETSTGKDNSRQERIFSGIGVEFVTNGRAIRRALQFERRFNAATHSRTWKLLQAGEGVKATPIYLFLSPLADDFFAA